MRRFACSLGQIRILKSKLSYFATITLGFSLNMIGVGKSKLFLRLDFFFTTRRFRQSIFPVDSSVSHIVSPASRKTVDEGGGWQRLESRSGVTGDVPGFRVRVVATAHLSRPSLPCATRVRQVV